MKIQCTTTYDYTADLEDIFLVTVHRDDSLTVHSKRSGGVNIDITGEQAKTLAGKLLNAWAELKTARKNKGR